METGFYWDPASNGVNMVLYIYGVYKNTVLTRPVYTVITLHFVLTTNLQSTVAIFGEES